MILLDTAIESWRREFIGWYVIYTSYHQEESHDYQIQTILDWLDKNICNGTGCCWLNGPYSYDKFAWYFKDIDNATVFELTWG